MSLHWLWYIFVYCLLFIAFWKFNIMHYIVLLSLLYCIVSRYLNIIKNVFFCFMQVTAKRFIEVTTYWFAVLPYRYKNFNMQPAFTWLKYCWFSVKHYPINQSTWINNITIYAYNLLWNRYIDISRKISNNYAGARNLYLDSPTSLWKSATKKLVKKKNMAFFLLIYTTV